MATFDLDIRIARDADAVFAAINDIGRLPAWETGVVAVAVAPPGPPRVGTRVRKTRRTPMGHQTFTDEITAYDPERRVRAERVVDGMIRGSGSRWEVVPDGDGARLRVAVEMRAPGVWRVLEPFVARTGRAQMAAELQRLKDLLERVGAGSA